MGVDLLFVGLILVGLILTVNVVTERLRQLNEAQSELNHFKIVTDECLAKTKDETEQLKELEGTVRELDQEYQTLSDKEHSLETQVAELQLKLPKKPSAHIG